MRRGGKCFPAANTHLSVNECMQRQARVSLSPQLWKLNWVSGAQRELITENQSKVLILSWKRLEYSTRTFSSSKIRFFTSLLLTFHTKHDILQDVDTEL